MMVNKPSGPTFLSNQISQTTDTMRKGMERIASGKRILTGADDAAGLAVSMAMESQARGLMVQIGNRQDEISLLQTAEGAMAGTNDMLQRVRELSLQAANGTLTEGDRANIQFEIDQLNQQINQTAANTQYNTKSLLDGTFKMQLQNGNSLDISNMDAASLGVADLDVTTQANAGASIGTIDQAISTVTSERSRLGAVSNGVASEIQGLQQEMVSTLAAQSRIADADIAAEVIQLTTQQIQQQASIQAFRMDAAQRGNVLKLLS